METWSPRWSVSSLINETVPGRLQRDGRGDGGRRDDRRARRLRRTRGRRGRARARPRSARRQRRQRRGVGRRGRRAGPRARADRFGRRGCAPARRADLARGRARAGDRPGRRHGNDARRPRAARTLDGGRPGCRRTPVTGGPPRTARRGRRPGLRVLAPVRADLGGRGGGPRARPRAFRRRRRGVVAHDPLVRRRPVLRVVRTRHDAPGELARGGGAHGASRGRCLRRAGAAFPRRLPEARRRGRVDVVGGARDPQHDRPRSARRIRPAPATRSTACCSHRSWRAVPRATRSAAACRAGARVAASFETWPERPRPTEAELPSGRWRR